MFHTSVQRVAALCLSLALIGLTGCDSTTGVDGEADVTLQGRVTDDSGFGKASGAQGDVEGAVVTAANVSADGSLNQLEGEATTNADGRFRLDVDGAADEIIVVAQKSEFESRAMVQTRGQSSVNTMPLTAESHAEADVFVEARKQDDGDEVSMSDVAVFVTSQVGADVRSGSRSASDVAASLLAEARARTEFVRDEEGEEEAEEARENENEAFFELQANLSVATNAGAQAAAISQFEEALIDAYTAAGVAIETQAKARQTSRAAVVHLGSATFDMEKQTILLASMATARAIEASFEAAGASNTRLSALVQARENMVAELRAASSAAAAAEAKADYEASAKAELAAEANVDQSTLETASAAVSTAKTALSAALVAAGSAAGVVNAHAEFYASAESAAEAALEGATTNASLAATVLAMLSAS